jgi:hypothetical protein
VSWCVDVPQVAGIAPRCTWVACRPKSQRSLSDRGLTSSASILIAYPMVILTNETCGLAIFLLTTTSGVEFGMKT